MVNVFNGVMGYDVVFFGEAGAECCLDFFGAFVYGGGFLGAGVYEVDLIGVL
jgi:hypothetical protein